jgi:hypothetical protein
MYRAGSDNIETVNRNDGRTCAELTHRTERLFTLQKGTLLSKLSTGMMYVAVGTCKVRTDTPDRKTLHAPEGCAAVETVHRHDVRYVRVRTGTRTSSELTHRTERLVQLQKVLLC